MKSAAAGLERIRNCRRALVEAAAPPSGSRSHMAAFEQAMSDDLNTANAISAIFDMVKAANIALREGGKVDGFLEQLDLMCDLLGLDLTNSDIQNTFSTNEIEGLVEERNAAKSAKNWALADEIRQKLLDMGITIKDTREGTKWHFGE